MCTYKIILCFIKLRKYKLLITNGNHINDWFYNFEWNCILVIHDI